MTDVPLPSYGTPTFVFTDIVGSTKAARRIPYRDYKGELLDPQFAAFSALIQKHNGQECGTPAGDSILAAFPSPMDALNCAIEMQQVMPTIHHIDRDNLATTLAVRIGMHTSEQMIVPGEYTSHPEVIHAARIMAIANAGQILYSNGTKVRAGTLPWKERCWSSRRIKDWEEQPEDVYELLYDGDTSRPEPGYLYAPEWFREFNHYIPRPKLEKEVLGLFEKMPNGTFNRLVTLHGFGGMGKTRLGVQCCLLAAGMFAGRLQLIRLETVGNSVLPNDRTRAEFLTGRIAEAFQLNTDGLTTDNLPERLPTEKTLLLLDNFETVHGSEVLKLVFRMLDKRPSLHILITSREAVKISSIGRVKEIVGMETDDARRLLLARIELKRTDWQLSAKDEAAIERLLDQTECFPLAIELVAAHADEFTLTEIAESLGKNVLGEMTKPAYGEFNFDETGRHHSLENCFFWSWNLLTQEVQQALLRLSHFASNSPHDEIAECFPTVQRVHLTALVNASLVNRSEENGESIYDMLNPTRAFARARLVEQDDDLSLRRQFIAHYRKLTEENGGEENVEDAEKRGRLERSWRHADSAAEVAAELQDADACGDIANNLIHFFQRQARWSDALPLFERSLTVSRAVLPAEHPSIAINLNNLADLYRMQGRYNEAEPLYRQALEIRQAILPTAYPDIATSLNNLALLYVSQGRFTDAEPLYKQALEMRQSVLPADHPSIAQSLNNLAGLYQEKGRFTDAEPLFKQALAIWESTLPAGHPDIAISLNNLALLYPAQGRLSDAESLFKRALAIWENAYPSDHPTIARSLYNLAYVHQAQERYQEAEPLFKRAQAIWESTLPSGHPDIARSPNRLAGLYQMQGRYEEAEPLYKQAIDIFLKALGPQHPNTVAALGNYLGMLIEQGRQDEIEVFLTANPELAETYQLHLVKSQPQ